MYLISTLSGWFSVVPPPWVTDELGELVLMVVVSSLWERNEDVVTSGSVTGNGSGVAVTYW